MLMSVMDHFCEFTITSGRLREDRGGKLSKIRPERIFNNSIIHFNQFVFTFCFVGVTFIIFIHGNVYVVQATATVKTKQTNRKT